MISSNSINVSYSESFLGTTVSVLTTTGYHSYETPSTLRKFSITNKKSTTITEKTTLIDINKNDFFETLLEYNADLSNILDSSVNEIPNILPSESLKLEQPSEEKNISKTNTDSILTKQSEIEMVTPLIPYFAKLSILSPNNFTQNLTLNSNFAEENSSYPISPISTSLKNNDQTKFSQTASNLTCINDNDCPSSEGCRNGHCANLCKAEERICAKNSICSVTNHTTYCLCLPGYLSKECIKGITLMYTL